MNVSMFRLPVVLLLACSSHAFSIIKQISIEESLLDKNHAMFFKSTTSQVSDDVKLQEEDELGKKYDFQLERKYVFMVGRGGNAF